MARLPTPGSDDGKWGAILNDYLSQSHDSTGKLKADSVGADQIQAGAVTKTDVGLGNVDDTSDIDKPISSATQAALDTKLAKTSLDSQTATNIQDNASATSTALSTAITSAVNAVGTSVTSMQTRVSQAENLLTLGGGAPPAQGQTVVLFGDSIVSQNAQQYNTVGGIGGVRAYNALGWFTQAQALLGHRFKLLKNAAISGENTAQMQARLNDDVIALDPDWCFMGGPTNSVTGIANGTRTMTDEKASLIAIWDALNAAGIKVVQCTVTPWNESSISADKAARRAALFQINQFIREQAKIRPNFVMVDWYTQLSSGVKSDWVAGHINPADVSGLHPTVQGANAMGRIFAQRVAPISVPIDILPPSNAETANLVNTVHANGAALALGTGGAVGVGGTGVVATGRRCDPLATSVFTCSQVPRTDGIPGVWDQIKVTSGWIKYGVNITGYGTTYSENDEVYAIAEFETDGDMPAGTGATNYCLLNLVAMRPDFGVGRQGYDFATSLTDPFPGGAYFPRKGVMMTPLVVVPSTATLRLALQFELKGAGTIRVGRIGVYKKNTGPGADIWSRSDANSS